MTKIYLRIFIGFWFINIASVLGHSIYVQWTETGFDGVLAEDSSYDRASLRALNRTSEVLMRWNLSILRKNLPTMPEYYFREVFILDEQGTELTGKTVEVKTSDILEKISRSNPFYRISENGHTYAARYILLPDGNFLRIVSSRTPNEDRYVRWRFSFSQNWSLYLAYLLVSGIACLVYARHLSQGINAFQTATHLIAKGDLSVRIAPHFKNRRDEIGNLSRDFDNMTARLEKSMKEQKRLIKDVSHELRSPLARLQFALGIAQQRGGKAVHGELEKARKAADYLNDIISTILSFPTSENDDWELSDVIDLCILLESLRNDLQDDAERQQVKIEFISDIKEGLVSTYGTTLSGVFENILGNALHYTLPDTLITIRVTQRGGSLCIAVYDQGPGVNEEELKDIFEPFYRTDEARDRASGGYGLGLSITQRTVHLHKGTITAENRSSGGLKVEVCLPLKILD